MDGDQSLHDLYRVDAAGKGTYERVYRAAEMLRKYQIDFNILTVVTTQTLKNAVTLLCAADRKSVV